MTIERSRLLEDATVTLAPGTKLGPYEIVAPLGQGGMGDVYRARDVRLGREVAIKALPPAFAADAERVARFEREARLLASLSHPNIAGIHGLELVDGHRYLVLEYVEGETLAARLVRGPLPPGEAADVCRQVAAGVEAAHEAGVVHRDLKPGNVMLRPDGTVKVLDFGLAKQGVPHGAASSDPSLLASPTMSYAPTAAGIILGTAAYMSPEQARGKAVDRRTDIWSFGCVLFECLTGRRAFDGETVSDLVARILEREPDWSALPAATPAALSALLVRCLAKDVKQRLQAIGEARIALERGPGAASIEAASVAPTRTRRLVWLPWAVAAVFAVIAVVRGFLPPDSGAQPERRVDLAFPAGQTRNAWTTPMLSPDGNRLAVVGRDSIGTRAWVRSLDQFEFQPVKGTEGTVFVCWSPDSRSLAFVTRNSLFRVSIEDGTVQKLADGFAGQRGLDWGANGDILYTPSPNASIWRIPASGGTPTQVTRLDTTLVDSSHRFPMWMPDGKRFLFALWSNNPRVNADQGGVYLASLNGDEPQRICTDRGRFFLLSSGHLVVRRNGALVALPFDMQAGRIETAAVTIAGRVGFDPDAGFVPASASAAGDIVFDEGAESPPADFAWLDRTGNRGAALGFRARFDSAVLSHDGSHVVGQIPDATGLSQLWIADLARRTVQPLTHGENDSYSPRWSPDGERVAFANRDTGTEDIYIQLAAGTRPPDRVWVARSVDTELSDWSADGRYLFFDGVPRSAPRTGQVWMLDLQGGAASVLLGGRFEQRDARLSPDGRWLAYVSAESGTDEVYLRSFPDLDRRWQVSTSGGHLPHWRADSRELVFGSGSGRDRAIWAVSFAPAAANPVGEPQRLFALPADAIDLAPAADHARFLALIRPSSPAEPAMRLLLGWKGGRRG